MLEYNKTKRGLHFAYPFFFNDKGVSVMEYREERKYFCSDYQLEILKHRLKAILPYDVHQKDSSYTISSLYFDTADNQCYYENSAGVDDRKNIVSVFTIILIQISGLRSKKNCVEKRKNLQSRSPAVSARI